MDESGGGIDIERSADNDEDVGLLRFFGSNGDIRYGLTEEHDVGPQQRTIARLRARCHLAVVLRQLHDVTRIVDVATRTDLHQFAMQMDDLRRASLLMQVVDILRNHGHIVLFFQSGHELMAIIRLYAPALLAKHVVEVCHQRRVGLPSFVGSHLGHGIFFPQPVGIAESLQSTFHRHACSCQYYNFLFHKHDDLY